MVMVLEAAHHPDLEICRCSIGITGSKFWNSLPKGIVDLPTAHGMQQFKSKTKELVNDFRKWKGGHAPVCINGTAGKMSESIRF
eukprot:g41998.t1